MKAFILFIVCVLLALTTSASQVSLNGERGPRVTLKNVESITNGKSKKKENPSDQQQWFGGGFVETVTTKKRNPRSQW